MSITTRESTNRPTMKNKGKKPQKFSGTVTTQGKPRPGRENQRKAFPAPASPVKE
jgi:hypothetical protein